MRRLALRQLRSDEGLTLVETVAALLVFALMMSGLAAGMALYAHNTALTKARNAATSVAQQVIESGKTLGVGDLDVCTGGGAPSTYTIPGTSTALPVLTGSTPCVSYSSTKTVGTRTFTVTQVVASMGTVTVSNQPLIKKLYSVTVSWSAPTPGSYTTRTVVSGKDTVSSTTPVGLQININDSTTNSLVTGAALFWDYTVKDGLGNTLQSGTTEDGTTGVLSVSPGSYTCSVIAEDDAGQSYSPGSNAGMTIDTNTDTITGTCTVTANNVTQWTTSWDPITSCSSVATKGSLNVTVTDQSGNLVSGALVALTNVTTGTSSLSATTGSSGASTGIAKFTGNVPGDLYTYTISKSGYTTSTNLGPVCVAANATSTATGTLQVQSTCVTSGSAKGSVSVLVQDENGNNVGGAKVVLANQDGHGSPGSVNTNNTTGIAFFNNNALAGNYTYTVSKSGYTTTGPVSGLCVVAATTTSQTVLLSTSASSGCAVSGSKGTLQVSVTDQSGAPLSGVKVTLKNANGHAGTPGAVSTGNTGIAGVAVFNNNVPADLYTYTLTVPTGYTDPGTVGPFCVIAGITNSQASSLVGIMTVKVSVTNSDTQPTKQYNVYLTDTGGSKSSNTVTVNRNKTGTVTFSSMPTDTYTVEVCVPIAKTGNCDDINTTSTTYNFGTKGSTYTVSVTDVKGGA